MMFAVIFITLVLGHCSAKEMRFIAVGDWGTDTDDQYAVAEAMGEWAAEHGCDFILSTGDNFYDNGVIGSDDPRFQTTWMDVYNHSGIAHLPWYVSLGNHDHGPGNGSEWYQVWYSETEPRWHMPNLTYSLSLPANSATVLFVAIDTESLRKDKNDKKSMLGYLKHQLQTSKADWKIVFGHHPTFSCGNYAGSEIIRRDVLPIMLEEHVDMYIAGHDHNLEHWQAENDSRIDFIVSGAGGRPVNQYSEKNHEQMQQLGMDMLFFKDVYGFAYFTIDDYDISVQFIDTELRQIYEFKRSNGNVNYCNQMTLLLVSSILFTWL